ncbi:hypothetical protein DE146DRAFT_15743 [Phaeosphaeria sp. MPI-PUGE-AT-0046c]|nr:hypothetical protein DE146DRAFT_15743 [Phaeosphaeria sp. MPI-PUGE-AT-0046c]
MPRQLPWLNQGSGSRTQTKRPARAKAGITAPSDIGDDFFDGTVLATASKGKGKGKAVEVDKDSDEDLPISTSTQLGARDLTRKVRAPSSSPPPIVDDVQPDVEEMRRGVSRFELRDDEWMMVEDEFLETAKLFTRHMRLAEYEKLKEQIEAKKNEQVQGPRPVVTGGKLSAEGAMKKKAEVQEKRQRKAIQDVFASQQDDDEMGTGTQASSFTARSTTTSMKQPPRPFIIQDSDSDDLDALRPSFKRPAPRPITSSATSASGLKFVSPTGQRPAVPAGPTSSFTEPALPAPKRPVGTTRRSRFNIDMFDDYTPPANITSPRPDVHASKVHSPSKPALSSSPVTVKIETKVSDDWGSRLSKETAERIAKRKAERNKEQETRKKSARMDDIPTFLV